MDGNGKTDNSSPTSNNSKDYIKSLMLWFEQSMGKGEPGCLDFSMVRPQGQTLSQNDGQTNEASTQSPIQQNGESTAALQGQSETKEC